MTVDGSWMDLGKPFFQHRFHITSRETEPCKIGNGYLPTSIAVEIHSK